jgi:hypothetical protein
MTEVATPPKSKYWNEDKKKFTITTQFKDKNTGEAVGPIQYFEADTLEELLEKKDAAHENAAVKLYETRKANKLGVVLEPDKDEPIQTFEERPLTADERVKLTKALSDPTTSLEAFRTLSEAVYGAPAEKIREALRQVEIDKRVGQIQFAISEFKSAHPEYVESAENKANLLKYLEKKNYPITKKNLEIAFEDLLRDELILVRAPKAPEPVTPVTPVVTAPPTVPEIPVAVTPAPAIPEESVEVRARQSSSGLGRSNSSAAPGVAPPKAAGITARDIVKMDSKTYAEFICDPENRKLVDALYAKK